MKSFFDKCVGVFCAGMILCCLVGIANAQTPVATITEGTWDLYRGISIARDAAGNQLRGLPTLAACARAAEGLGAVRDYTCRTRAGVSVTLSAPPPPPPAPVDCVVSAWEAWQGGAWSACSSGTQTRTETRQRMIVTPASNGGQVCPALTETRVASQACAVTPPPPPPPAGAGTPLSMLPSSYPVWTAGGARHENIPGAAWDGSPVARIWPPTSGQTYGGIGGFNITPARSLAVRWEMRAGPNYASAGRSTDDNKHVIIHTRNGNRPMINLQPTGSCLQMAIAQGTVKQFNQRAQGGLPQGLFRGEGNEVFRWCDTATRAGDVGAGEWLTISLHVTCEPTLHSSGSIRAAVWSRTAKLADWWIPWNYDRPATCSDITSIEAIGDYYNGPFANVPERWFDIAGLTIIPGASAPPEPRAGFLQ